jgi:hypothetical protein
MLVDQAVVVPGPITEALGAAARAAGSYVVIGAQEILYADVELHAVRAARRFFDPVGHYSRPDIFQQRVDTRCRPAVVLDHTSDSQTPVEPTAKPATPNP